MPSGAKILLITGQGMPVFDSETPLLVEALTAAGIESETVAWRAARDWSAAPLVLLRSPWDYTGHWQDFLAWTDHVGGSTRLLNPPEIIRWNSHKQYLLELQRCGVPAMPTALLRRGESIDTRRTLSTLADRFRSSDLIVKPAIGINAQGAKRGRAEDPSIASHLRGLLDEGDALVQPFASQILSAGECSLIFFGGQFSHAVRKRPRDGDFRVQDNHGGTVAPYEPSAAELRTAGAALAAAPGECAYARVDLVSFDGNPAVMELELIEPELFLRHSPRAAQSFAEDLATELGRGN